MRFLISSDPKALQALNPDASVEAEFGDVVVTGSILTMAHHGPRAGSPAPCSYPNCPAEGIETVALSHVDLDTIGGCAALLGRKPDEESFWDLAEFVDLNGGHKLSESGANESDLLALHAYWAWSKDHRVFAPRDGSVLDVTEQVLEHVNIVEAILEGGRVLLDAGEAFRKADDTLNRESFRKMIGPIVLRQSEQFANHLYVAPGGEIARGCVTHNPSEDLPGGAITMSLADPIPNVSCGEILKNLFGEEAGGHAGIGGSERGKARPFADAGMAARYLVDEVTVAIALGLAEVAHADQTKEGEPYFAHVVEVERLVRTSGGGDSYERILAALHDVLEKGQFEGEPYTEAKLFELLRLQRFEHASSIVDDVMQLGNEEKRLDPKVGRKVWVPKETARFNEAKHSIRVVKQADLISNLAALLPGDDGNSGQIKAARVLVEECDGFELNTGTHLDELLEDEIATTEERIEIAIKRRAERKAVAS